MSYSVRVDHESLTRALDAVPGALHRRWHEGFRDVLIDFDRTFKRGRLSGRPGLLVRSGSLRRSFLWRTRAGRGIGDLIGIFFTNLIYAAIHEFGGVVRPTRAKFLTIPTDFAKTPAGVTRGRARDFPNTFIAKNTIFQRRGQKIVPLFWLKREVRIPPRLELGKSWLGNAGPVADRLNQATAKALEDAGF